MCVGVLWAHARARAAGHDLFGERARSCTILVSMESIESFLQLRRELTRRAFVERLPGYMFLKSPFSRPQSGPIEYETATFRADDPAIELSTLPSWAIARITKRDGNPFPDRISIGRALNCDVVLRLSFVSKLHAHLLLEEGRIKALVDNRSTNGTKINGVSLVAGKPMPVVSDDRVSFGDLDLTLVTGAELYDRLATSI